MIIEKILKQLTPERIEKEIKAIQRVKLPPELQKWVKEYEKVGDRDEFIWKWLYEMNKVSPFLTISKELFISLQKIKTLVNMFIILVDDMSERKNKKRLLKELLKIPFEKKYIEFKEFSLSDKKYLNFTIKVWHEIKKIEKRFPRYKDYREVFDYDIQQFLNEVRYAYLIYKDPFWMNELEYWTYFPQGMQIIIDFDLDLMCFSKKINKTELGLSRKIVLILQKMGRVGNWISTWEREAIKGDFTSGIFPYAIEHNLISLKNLSEKRKKDIIKRIKNSNAERYLLKKWEEYYKEITKCSGKVNIINIREILKNFEQLLFMHLISRGYK